MADGYYDADGNWVGSGGTGSATAYKTPAGIDTQPLPTTDEQTLNVRNTRYQAARGAALDLQAVRERNAQSDLPPGSPTNYLDRGGAPLGPVKLDEFNIPKPAPLAATGLRGYPSAAEVSAFNANDAARARAEQFQSEVDAASSRYPAAPKFAMPTTDDLIDRGIQAQRNQTENAINTRKVHLGLLPPSAIGASATTLDSEEAPVVSVGRHGQTRYGASQASQTRAELAVLSQQAGALDRAQQANIANKSRLVIESAKQNEIAAQDTARSQVVDFMNNIDPSRYPIGSPDREAFIGKVFGNRPDWLHVMAKDPHLSKYVQEHIDAHTTVANTMAALKQQYPDEESLPEVGGVRMVPSVNAKGQVSYRGLTGQTPDQKEESKLASMLHKTTGLTPDEFAAVDPSQVKAGGIFVSTGKPGEGVFHHAGGGFNVNGTPKGDFSDDFTKVVEGYKPGTKITPEQEKAARDAISSGGAIQIDTGKGYKAVIPRALHERFLSTFGNQGEAAPASGGGKKAMSLDDYRKSIGLDQQ